MSTDPQIQPAINQGLVSANSALETSISTLNSTQALQNTLATKEAEILAIQDTNNMTTIQLAGIPAVGKLRALFLLGSLKLVNCALNSQQGGYVHITSPIIIIMFLLNKFDHLGLNPTAATMLCLVL